MTLKRRVKNQCLHEKKTQKNLVPPGGKATIFDFGQLKRIILCTYTLFVIHVQYLFIGEAKPLGHK